MTDFALSFKILILYIYLMWRKTTQRQKMMRERKTKRQRRYSNRIHELQKNYVFLCHVTEQQNHLINKTRDADNL